MAFYVPLGIRGILFGVGTFLIGVMGGWVYWRAHVGESLAWVAERIGGMGGDEPGAESAPSGPTVRHSGGLE